MSDAGLTNDAEPAAPAWSRIPSWAWIVVAGVLAHGIVPLTDYVLWDGWWYAADLARPEGPTVMARLIAFGSISASRLSRFPTARSSSRCSPSSASILAGD